MPDASDDVWFLLHLGLTLVFTGTTASSTVSSAGPPLLSFLLHFTGVVPARNKCAEKEWQENARATYDENIAQLEKLCIGRSGETRSYVRT